MQFKKIIPPSILASTVKYLWILKIEEEDLPYDEQILPYSWFELYFSFTQKASNLDGKDMPFELIDSSLTGLPSSAFDLTYSEPTFIVGVSFQPWAANLVLNQPASNFVANTAQFSDFDMNELLIHELQNATNEQAIVSLLTHYILEKRKSYEVDKIAAFITQTATLEPEFLKKKIDGMGYSRRRVEQRFLESTGVTIGKYQSSVRFEKSIDLLSLDSESSLTQIGLNAGYYDQSHFIREFKKFTNVSPKVFRKQMQGLKPMQKELVTG